MRFVTLVRTSFAHSMVPSCDFLPQKLENSFFEENLSQAFLALRAFPTSLLAAFVNASTLGATSSYILFSTK